MSEEPEKLPRPRLTVLAIIGIVWMALSGLCTATLGTAFIADPTYGRFLWPFVLGIGGLCILPGLLMFLLGRRK